jgi:hypothetical protein
VRLFTLYSAVLPQGAVEYALDGLLKHFSLEIGMATKKTVNSGKGASKRRAASKKGSDKKKLGICFTIMPFGGWFNDYYLNIYRPAIEAAGMKPHRADDLYRPSTIVNDIWSYTRQAKIVLADLTGKNPNVFYELGLAHALAKPAILVAESMDDVPFDLRSLRVIEYDKNDPDWGETLKEKIGNAIKEVLEAPLQAVLPAFLEVKPSKERASVSKHEKELLELRQEIESIRADVRSRVPDERQPLIKAEEAEELIKHYLSIGMPPRLIISRLSARGAPRVWIERRIDDLMPQPELSLEVVGESARSAEQARGKRKRKVTNKVSAKKSPAVASKKSKKGT